MKYNIKIIQKDRDTFKEKRLILEATILANDFDAHDTGGLIFALEFAANKNEINPMRVHISEVL